MKNRLYMLAKLALFLIAVNAQASAPLPTITVDHSPSTLKVGEAYNITWSTTNAYKVVYSCTKQDSTYAYAAFVGTSGRLDGVPPASWAGTSYSCSFYAYNTDEVTAGGAYGMSVAAIASPQSISFAALSNRVAGSAPFSLSASASSGLAIAFSSSTPSVCTMSGSTVTLAAAGQCTIAANQAGNANFSAAPQVNQSFSVTSALSSQTITFGQLFNRVVGSAPFNVTATASSGLTVSFSSLTQTACTVTGSTVTLVAVGTCIIAANQAGDASYSAATQAARSFYVAANQSNQTISFAALSDRTIAAAPFAVSATSSSSLVVVFTSLTPTVCTVSGTTVTLAGAGQCIVAANQGGNASFSAAAQVSQSFAVASAFSSQTISFSTLANRDVSSAPFVLSASASSGLAVDFRSLSAAVCTVAGSTVTLVAGGQCTIAANQAGSLSFSAAPQVIQSFSVISPYISPECLTQTPTSRVITGSMSGGAIWGNNSGGYTIDSDINKAAVHAGLLAPGTSGNITITALGQQLIYNGTTANGLTSLNYSTLFCAMRLSSGAARAAQSISFAPLTSRVAGTPTFAIAATASSSLAVSFSSLTQSICTVGSSFVTPRAAGQCTIAANQAGNADFSSAPEVLQSFSVTAGQPLALLSVDHSPKPLIAGQPYSITWSTTGASKVTYSCEKPDSMYPQAAIVGASGRLDGVAPLAWDKTSFNCSWQATNADDRITFLTDTLVTGLAPPPPTITLSKQTMTAGASFALTWSTTNATAVSYTCSSYDGAFSGSESGLPPSGSVTGTASESWVGKRSTCSWTATGVSGSRTATSEWVVNPSGSELIVGQDPDPIVAGRPYRWFWSAPSASGAIASCSVPGVPLLQKELANVGSFTETADPDWAGKSMRCLWFAYDTNGNSWSREINVAIVAPPPPKPTIVFFHNPVQLVAGEPFTTTWTTTNATSLYRICTGAGTVASEELALNGSKTEIAQAVWASQPASCEWSAFGLGGGEQKTEALSIAHQPATLEVSWYPQILVAGQPFTWTWTSTNATSVRFSCAKYNEESVSRTVSLNGTLTEIARSDWVTPPVGCSWLASSPAGNASRTMNMYAVPSTTAVDAEYISQSVPATAVAGSVVNVSVTMKNIGYAAWTAQDTLRLVAVNPLNNTTWSVSAVPLATTVAKGDSTTFSFSVIAPWTVGNHKFQWQMQKGGATMVGHPSPSTTVVVTPNTSPNELPAVSSPNFPNGKTIRVPEGTIKYDLLMSGIGTDSDGQVVKLEVLANHTQLVAEFNTDRFNGPVPLPIGTTTVTLRATDNRGATNLIVYDLRVAAVDPTIEIINARVTIVGGIVAVGETLTAGLAASIKMVNPGSAVVFVELYEGMTKLDSRNFSLSYLADGTVRNVARNVSIAVPLAVGSHKLRLRAFSNESEFIESAIFTITVNNQNALPSASILNPENGSSFNADEGQFATVAIAAEAADVDGTVTKLDFLINDVVRASGASSINHTIELGRGSHVLMARATDNLGGIGFSAPITVLVARTAGGNPNLKSALSATSTNARAIGNQPVEVGFTASGSNSGGIVSKVELLQENAARTAFLAVESQAAANPPTSSLSWSTTRSLLPGVYRFKLRVSDGNGHIALSDPPIVVNVTNSSLLGNITGVRVDSAGVPKLTGWVCRDGSAETLAFSMYTHAPTAAAGGKLVKSGIANLATDPDNAVVQEACHTPGVGHHFSIDLPAASAGIAGGISANSALYVQARTVGGENIILPCADNYCTMPGSLRIGLTTPLNNATYVAPGPVFMRAKLANGTGPYDEVAFSFDGEWIAAQPDTEANTYVATKTGVAARTAQYPVTARVRQGASTLFSVVNMVTVTAPAGPTVTLSKPAVGETGMAGAPVALGAVLGGGAMPAGGTVHFYAGSTKIGVGANSGSTWTATWTPLLEGVQAITAKVISGEGVVIAQSAAIDITITPGTGSSALPIPVMITPPHMADADAGTLPGNLSVGSNGAANYSIGIVVPPGTAGMEPQLSLSYSSQDANTLLGLGWRLGGMSSIHRCGKTIAQDQVNGRIAFDTADRLCLDGQRLVLVGNEVNDNNYWAADAEFRTEIDTFVRIKAAGPIGARTYEARTKDGRMLRYGGATSKISVVPTTLVKSGAQGWALEEIKDRSGNFIKFEYEQSLQNGEHRPKAIRYGGNGQAAHAAVEFIYVEEGKLEKDRPDAWTRYIDETRHDLRSRLYSVKTYAGEDLTNLNNGSLVRNYKLSYEMSSTSGRSLLNSIQVCADNPVTAVPKCLPATTFSWGKPDKAAGFAPPVNWTGAPILTKSNALRGEMHAEYFAFADFGNDGRSDILEKRVAPAFVLGAPKTVDGLDTGFKQSQYRYFHNTGSGFAVYNYRLNTSEAFVVLDIGDFNGDGSPDLMVNSGGMAKVCLSPLGDGASPGSASTTVVFTCDTSNYLVRGSNEPDNLPYLIDVLGNGKTAQYTQIDRTEQAYLCMGTTCSLDPNPPAVLATTYGNDGTPSFQQNHYTTLAQMVDFAGRGKAYDVRWSTPAYVEYYYSDGGQTKHEDKTWHNLKPTISMTSFNLPRGPGELAPPGAMETYEYLKEYAAPGPTANKSPYSFDMLSRNGNLSADFSGSGYSSLSFGFLEQVYPGIAGMPVKRFTLSDFTVCQSTGRALKCDARQKYSGENYRAIATIADFTGDGHPAILAQVRKRDAQGYALAAGVLEVCRLSGDDTTSVIGTDSNMVCEPWTSAPVDTDNAYFLDLQGTGRVQMVIYHPGKVVDGVWHEDGRWELHAPIDRAAPDQALDRIHTFTNGLGSTSTVKYADGLTTLVDGSAMNPLVGQSGVTDLTAKYPQHLVRTPRKVVYELLTDNGIGVPNSTSYRYLDAATDVAGRGDLGFGSVIVTDAQTGIVTTTRYSHSWPYTGMVISQIVRSGSVELSKTENKFLTKHGNGGRTVYPIVYDSTTVRNDLERNCNSGDACAMGAARTLTVYDDFGNVTSQDTSTSGAGKTFRSINVTTYRNDTTNWLIGLAENAKTTKSAPGTSDITRTVDFAYHPLTGLLEKETIEKGDLQLQVVTEHLRDGNPFGLVHTRKQTWRDRPTASERFRYQSRTVFDAKGRYPESIKNALGHEETRTYYPGTGAVRTLTGPNSLTTTWTADGFGRVERELRADGNETRIWNKLCDSDCMGGKIVKITEQFHAGIRISVPQLEYSDRVGHIVGGRSWGFDGTQIEMKTEYDTQGRVKANFHPRYIGSSWIMSAEFDYDLLGRVVKSTTFGETGGALLTRSVYAGLITNLTNPRNQVKEEKRNAIGQLELVTNVGAAEDEEDKDVVTRFAYDAFGNLRQTIDPSGNVINVEYDRLGRKTVLKDPDLGEVHYTPDPLGRVLVQSTPMQRDRKPVADRTDFTYDDLDRMTERYDRDLRSEWKFDTAAKGKGQLAESYTLAGAIKDYHRVLAYDEFGRPFSTTQKLTNGEYSTTLIFDAWGRLSTSIHKPAKGNTKTYDSRYNGFGYLARVERGALVLWRASKQDAANRVIESVLGNGLLQTRDFDAESGRLTGSKLTNGEGGLRRLEEGYSYDAIGNVDQRTQQLDSNGFIEDFTYDGLNRIKTSKILATGAVQNFRYFKDGSIKSKTGVGAGDYVYPAQGVSAQPHAVSSIPGIGAFLYDANGNLLEGDRRTIGWTSFDMPAWIVRDGSSSSFRYGSEYQRTLQTRGDGSTIIYAGVQEVETAVSGTVKVKTYWPNGIGFEAETIIGATRTNRMFWTHADRLGSPVAITTETGAIEEKLAFDPWGKRRDVDNHATPDSLDGKTDNKGFTNHEMLDQLDLVHMNGRVYDPLIGKFLSADPFIQDPMNGQNYSRYSYVLNNPLNFTDPSGFTAEAVGRIVITGCGPTCQIRMWKLARELNILAEMYARKVSIEASKQIAKNRGAAAALGRTAAATAIRAAGTLGMLFTSSNEFQKSDEEAIMASWRGKEDAAKAKAAMAESLSSDSGDDTNSGDQAHVLDDKGETHILDGDATGGGHRPGTGKPGKSEFPSNWTDDKIRGAIVDVANDPSSTRSPGRGGRTEIRGTRDGVDILVVVEPGSKGGRIVTAHPENGPRNPRR